MDARAISTAGPSARTERSAGSPAHSMLIAQISDTHIETAAPATRARITDLARVVRSISELVPRPDVVLHTGDIAHDGTAKDYAAARAELSRLAQPVFATVGNRDRRAEFRAAFGADGYLDPDCGFAQYAIEIGELRLVAVDTLDDTSALGGFCADREARLDRLLAASARPTIVFLHHPPLSVPDIKGPPLQFREPERAAALIRCLAGAPAVIHVAAGHVHRSRTLMLGEVMLTTMPSVAVDLSRERAPAHTGGRPVYHLHRVVGREVATMSVVV